jgi:hypothetical protein
MAIGQHKVKTVQIEEKGRNGERIPFLRIPTTHFSRL